MDVKTVLVIGSGAMGTGIAQICAQSGYRVLIYDKVTENVEKAINSIQNNLDRRVAKQAITMEEKENVLGRICKRDSLSCAVQADLIIEAVWEDMELKKDIFREVSTYAKENTIFATNTSTLSITSIANAVKKPENFIGIHFFNPVTAMRLIEIVPGMLTLQQTVEWARSFGASLNKETIVAKDSPGFIVNRLLHVMLNEAAYLVQEGISPSDIDKGMKYGLNHPMGPLELADFGGVDLLLSCMEIYWNEFQDTKYRPPLLLKRMVEAGYNGKRSGGGFYKY